MGGSSARFFNVDIHGKYSGALWHKVFIHRPHDFFYALRNRFYKARYRFHPKYKRHLINTGLKPGPHAAGRLILHGVFAVLVRYVEEQGGYEELLKFTQNLETAMPHHGPAKVTTRQATLQREVLALFEWWTVEYPGIKAARKLRAAEIYGGGPLFIDTPATEDTPRHVRLRSIPRSDRDELKNLTAEIERQEYEMICRLAFIRDALD